MNHTATAIAATLLRVSMGFMFIAHGLFLKFMEYGVGGTVAYFASIGYPAVMAHLVMAAETIGGIMLLLGLQVRMVAATLIPLMVVATMQHIANGWLFSAPNGGFEFAMFWMLALVVQVLLGGGAYALGATSRARDTPTYAPRYASVSRY